MVLLANGSSIPDGFEMWAAVVRACLSIHAASPFYTVAMTSRTRNRTWQLQCQASLTWSSHARLGETLVRHYHPEHTRAAAKTEEAAVVNGQVPFPPEAPGGNSQTCAATPSLVIFQQTAKPSNLLNDNMSIHPAGSHSLSKIPCKTTKPGCFTKPLQLSLETC